tara:strand:- start:1078 stop:1410 length:333 start_codon:yes stop_codon:yes gene_type:complete
MNISDLEWSKRILLISVKNENNKILKLAQNFFKENECEKKDRNIELIIFINFKNKKFNAPDFIKNNYGIWLLGYDGLVKDFSTDEKILLRMFDLIDSMPMRKNELKNDTC